MAERLRLIVLVIPGLGGSVLASPDGSWRVGPRLGDVAACLRDPERLSCEANPRLAPVDLVRSAHVGPWRLAGGYGELLAALDRRFGRPRVEVMKSADRPSSAGPADVLLFPYDYRLGIRDAAERLGECLDARLGGTGREQRQARWRVVVVAHSMGGLVARHWIARGNGAQYCTTLITLGTPHRGTPQMLDQLINGVGTGPVRFDAATAVLRGWPSAYELLPQYPVVLPAAQRRNPNPVLTDLLRPGELNQNLVGARFLDGVKAGRAEHEAIKTGWEALSRAGLAPDVIPVCGRGHPTLTHFEEREGSLRAVADRAPSWLPFGRWRGDGTVPAVSTLPREFDEHRGAWRIWANRHRMLPSTEDVIELLSTLNEDTARDIQRGRVTRARLSLGLSLPDLAVECEPIGVKVELIGDHPQDAAGGRVMVRDTASGRRCYEGPLARLGEEPASADGSPGGQRARYWVHRIPGLKAGLYSVKTGLSAIPGHRDVVTEDVLAVVAA